jgi:MtN3 and saliva related transmembrane protein
MLLLKSFFDPTGTFFWICGIIASLGLVLGYVPQAIQTIRTRKTDDIALPTFLMIGIGGIAFMLQGIMLGIFGEGFAIFWTNLITTICSVIIFGIKMYNDYFKKDKEKK